MASAFEERKTKYIESVMAELFPQEQTSWQHTSATYHSINEFAARSGMKVNTKEPVHFRRPQKEWLIAAAMLIVTFFLLYLVWQNKLSWVLFVFLVVMLLIVLPRLLDNKTMIRVTKEGIWLQALQKNVLWNDLVIILIKEVVVEQPLYYLVLHYYDESKAEFLKTEITLDGLVSPAILSATIEAFRNETAE